MEYSVSDIVNDVRVALDENVRTGSGIVAQLEELGDPDTLTLDDIIESKVEDAARLVLENAAHWLLGEGIAIPGSLIVPRETGYVTGTMELPEDFLRLLTFKMSSWRMPVTVAVTEDSPLYEVQSSPYAGVRGNPERPVVAITHQGDGSSGLLLECYSCTEGDTLVKARYIAVPKVSGGKIVLPGKLYRAVVYRTASLTALAVKDGEAAAALLSTSNELAGIESA